MAKSRGFPLTGNLTDKQFTKCWDSLSANRKVDIRLKADEFDLTIKNVLNRWPALRIETK